MIRERNLSRESATEMYREHFARRFHAASAIQCGFNFIHNTIYFVKKLELFSIGIKKR